MRGFGGGKSRKKRGCGRGGNVRDVGNEQGNKVKERKQTQEVRLFLSTTIPPLLHAFSPDVILVLN